MSKVKGSIAILGSGETSPNLVSVHRKLIKNLEGKINAYLIDTPFGFQENADELVKKLVEFYKKSINIEIKLASFRDKKAINSINYFEMLEEISKSNFIFAGPGSPSYASKTWCDSKIPNLFKDHIIKGGNAIFSSAAASTLGNKTLPVYEIYKVGLDPYWEKGLNVLEIFNLNCTIIPHFNNKEGGTHDTSFSYVGKRRMDTLLENEFTNIVGIDEHTGLIINGENNTFEVEGIGNVTVINHKEKKEFKKENTYSLDQLKDLLPFSKEDIYQNKVNENELDEVTELNEKIAKLKLEIKNEKNYSQMFDTLVTDLISLRNSLRDDKKFNESDNIRNLFEKLDIVIEDDKRSSSWSFKDL